MKTRTLALRVALNSAVMILLVYFVMQTVVFIRDCFIFDSGGIDGWMATTLGFIGTRVLPPLIIFGGILFVLARPIQKVGERLDAGETVSPEVAEQTRLRILRFRGIVLAVNVIGFTVGFFLDIILSGRLGELVQVHRMTVLGGNLTAAFVFSAAQTALNNVTFAEVRDKLGLTSIGNRRREVSATTRQFRITVGLVLYAAFVIQYNQHDVTVIQSWSTEVLTRVANGEVPAAEAGDAWRAVAAQGMVTLTTRDPATAASLKAPWESGEAPWVLQEEVFLTVGLMMLLLTLGVQWAVSREQRQTVSALGSRLRDVVAGGGDLRKRLSLRSLDEFGELGDLVNRQLDQFQDIVKRIGGAAAQTREGAQAVEAVLTRAEVVSTEVGASVEALKHELEDQAQQARILSEALGAFREAAEAVDAEAATQSRFVAETSAAMDEMGASIEGVREKSRQAGALTEDLSRQGEGGGQAVLQTSEAITAIHRTSLEVLDVLGALKKISADINLLAMNAAIEAAHAGEKGAGFAVVADEVRKLANTAQTQTKSIKDLITAMARQVEAGVERAKTSGAVLAELVKGLQDSAAVSRAVAEAMEEQADRTRTVGNSLDQVVQTSDAIRSKMTTQDETTDRMSESLGTTLDRLAGLVMTSQSQAVAVASLEAAFAEVRREVDRNAAAADTLKAEIGRFQV